MAGPAKFDDQDFQDFLSKKKVLLGMVNMLVGNNDWQSNTASHVLKEVSPYYNLRPNVPVLFIHGTADDTVPYKQSELMYSALQEKGNSHYHLFSMREKSHDLLSNENRAESIQAMIKFLTVVGQQ